MKYFIGADLGTSSLKLLLCDKDGKIYRSITEFYDVFYPNAGWSEQDPNDWWNAFAKGIRELIKGFDKENISAIAVAGQMHGLVILDKNDNVIRPAILWNDGRSSAETEYLNGTVGKDMLTKWTGNIAFAGFTAPKILWLKRNEHKSFEKIDKIMLPKDYINYMLTGVYSCDYSDASGTLLLDVKNRCWSANMLDICDVKAEQMPRLFESFEIIGRITDAVAELLGLSRDTVVAAGAGDNAGAAVGMGALENVRCNISLGTSGTVFIASDEFVCDSSSALHYFCHADGKYHIMACMLSAASCNKWFCNNVLHSEDYGAIQARISDDMLGEGEVFFLPYLMGERSPINDTDATGVFLGLHPDTDDVDMLLAVMEGVAFAMRENLDVVKNMGIQIESATVCGGGARSELWVKIFANVLGIELSIIESEEGPALGAAYLAAISVGELNVNSLPKGNIKATVKPSTEIYEKYEKKYAKFRKIYPNMKRLFEELADK